MLKRKQNTIWNFIKRFIWLIILSSETNNIDDVTKPKSVYTVIAFIITQGSVPVVMRLKIFYSYTINRINGLHQRKCQIQDGMLKLHFNIPFHSIKILKRIKNKLTPQKKKMVAIEAKKMNDYETVIRQSYGMKLPRVNATINFYNLLTV